MSANGSATFKVKTEGITRDALLEKPPLLLHSVSRLRGLDVLFLGDGSKLAFFRRALSSLFLGEVFLGREQFLFLELILEPREGFDTIGVEETLEVRTLCGFLVERPFLLESKLDRLVGDSVESEVGDSAAGIGERKNGHELSRERGDATHEGKNTGKARTRQYARVVESVPFEGAEEGEIQTKRSVS